MNRPPLLKKGDLVAIAATARKVSRDEMAPAIELLKSWGLTVLESDGLFSENNQFSGDDHSRAGSFQKLLDDPAVKAILCARGGYGTVRIIDRLDFTSFKTNPKWIIGFSDITVLHSHIHTHFEIETLHGPMALNVMPERRDEASLESLRVSLMDAAVARIEAPCHSLNRKGESRGLLVGGNLSVLYSLLGSPSDIDTRGKILVLEDLDEYLYHIDRMMMNLRRNGKFDGLAGLVVGWMSDMKDNAIPFGMNAEEIIQHHCADYRFPIAFGFGIGHEPRNLALRLGAEASLHVSESGSRIEIL